MRHKEKKHRLRAQILSVLMPWCICGVVRMKPQPADRFYFPKRFSTFFLDEIRKISQDFFSTAQFWLTGFRPITLMFKCSCVRVCATSRKYAQIRLISCFTTSKHHDSTVHSVYLGRKNKKNNPIT